MSAFTISNSTTYPAKVVISKGTPGGASNLVGAVPVSPGGQTVVPTTQSYSAYFWITMEDGNSYKSSPVTFSSPSKVLTAQMQMVETGGTFNFQIEQSTGTAPNQIVLISECRNPVTFYVMTTTESVNPTSTLQTAVVVTQVNSISLSTAETYTFQGKINGVNTVPITTTPTSTNYPGVELYQDNVTFTDFVGYSLKFTG